MSRENDVFNFDVEDASFQEKIKEAERTLSLNGVKGDMVSAVLQQVMLTLTGKDIYPEKDVLSKEDFENPFRGGIGAEFTLIGPKYEEVLAALNDIIKDGDHDIKASDIIKGRNNIANGQSVTKFIIKDTDAGIVHYITYMMNERSSAPYGCIGYATSCDGPTADFRSSLNGSFYDAYKAEWIQDAPTFDPISSGYGYPYGTNLNEVAREDRRYKAEVYITDEVSGIFVTTATECIDQKTLSWLSSIVKEHGGKSTAIINEVFYTPSGERAYELTYLPDKTRMMTESELMKAMADNKVGIVNPELIGTEPERAPELADEFGSKPNSDDEPEL